MLPTGGCACHSSGLSVQSFLRGIHVVDYTRRGAARGRPATSSPSPAPRTSRRTAQAVLARRPRDRPGALTPRPRLADHRPPHDLEADAARRPAGPHRRTVRRSSTCRCALNTNENSYAVPPSRRGRDRRGGGRGRPPASTATPTASSPALREDLAAYLRAAARLTADAGLGGERLQRDPAAAAPGVRRPGPHRARLHAGVLDAPDHHADHRHDLGRRDARRPGGGAFDLDPASAVEQVRRHRPDVVFLCSPNNPTGTALDLDVVEAVHDAAAGALVVVDEAYAEFARPGTPSALTLLARAAAAGRHPHDEQGLRARRRPARVPRRRPGARRRAAPGADAVPPLDADPGGRARRAGARRPHARDGRGDQGPARPDRVGAGRPRASTRCPATPTSCCSAGSPTRT